MGDSNDKQTDPQSEPKSSELYKYCENCDLECCLDNRPRPLDKDKDHFCEEHAPKQTDPDRYQAVDTDVQQDEPDENLMNSILARLASDNKLKGKILQLEKKKVLLWSFPSCHDGDKTVIEENILQPTWINDLVNVYTKPKDPRLSLIELKIKEKINASDEENRQKIEELKDSVLEEIQPRCLERSNLEKSLSKFKRIQEYRKIDAKIIEIDKAIKDQLDRLGVGELKDEEIETQEATQKSRFLHINIGGTYDEKGVIEPDLWNRDQIVLDDRTNIARFKSLEQKIYNDTNTSLFLITSGVAPIYPSDRDILDAWQGGFDVDHIDKRVELSGKQWELTNKLNDLAKNSTIDNSD